MLPGAAPSTPPYYRRCRAVATRVRPGCLPSSLQPAQARRYMTCPHHGPGPPPWMPRERLGGGSSRPTVQQATAGRERPRTEKLLHSCVCWTRRPSALGTDSPPLYHLACPWSSCPPSTEEVVPGLEPTDGFAINATTPNLEPLAPLLDTIRPIGPIIHGIQKTLNISESHPTLPGHNLKNKTSLILLMPSAEVCGGEGAGAGGERSRLGGFRRVGPRPSTFECP
jgi:hypothetical protein